MKFSFGYTKNNNKTDLCEKCFCNSFLPLTVLEKMIFITLAASVHNRTFVNKGAKKIKSSKKRTLQVYQKELSSSNFYGRL